MGLAIQGATRRKNQDGAVGLRHHKLGIYHTQKAHSVTDWQLIPTEGVHMWGR